MNLERITDPVTEAQRWVLTLTRSELSRVRLDQIDQALLADIRDGEGSETPIADALLGLHTLAFRIEQQLSRSP